MISVPEPSQCNRLLDVLDDPIALAIVRALDGDPHSASEVAAACDLPLSTTYRKLDRLTDAGVLREGMRLRRSGKHMREYTRIVEEILVALGGADGADVLVRVKTEAAGKPMGVW